MPNLLRFNTTFQQPFRGRFHAFYDHYQILPVYSKDARVLIEIRQVKTAGIQLFVVYYQPRVFHVEDFHDSLVAVHENIHPTIPDILFHG